MTAFDTDVLTDLGKNIPTVVALAAAVPVADQFVPVVAAEEVLRGQMAAVRAAQAQGGPALVRAYAFLDETLSVLRGVQTLPYTTAAHALFLAWRGAKIRIGTRDLRIAAICIVHGARLATRNARDFAQVPGLNLEIWP